jgi:hypothetical protein
MTPMTRQRLALLAPFALLGAAACGDALAPELPTDGRPAALRLFLGAWTWGTLEVRLAGDTVVAVRRPDLGPATSGWTVRVVPGAAEWRAFWRAADAAGVRGWPSACENTGVVDGGGFEMELAYAGGGRIASRGANSFPRRDGRCADTTSDEYEAFLAAVAALVGRPIPGP